MKLIIISDSESDCGDEYALFRRPVLIPIKSKMTAKRKPKTSKKLKIIDKPKKLNLTKVLSTGGVIRSSERIAKQNTINIPASRENKYDSVSQFLRADKKLLNCFVLLERIDIHDLRTTNINIFEAKFSDNNFRTAFYSEENNNCSSQLQRSSNNIIKRSEFECDNDASKVSNRSNTRVLQVLVERLHNDTIKNTEEPSEHEDQIKLISKWTLSFETSEQVQLLVEGYIDGKIFSKVPVTCRLTSRKFRSVSNEIFCLHGNICDPDECIPPPLKTKFKEGFPRNWRIELAKWITCGNEVPQESLKSRYKKPVVQTSKYEMGFDLDSGQLSTFPIRRSSSGMQITVENNNKQLKCNSHHIEKENVRQSSRLAKRQATKNPVMHTALTSGKKNSNLSGNNNTKKSYKLRNLDVKKEVKAQVVLQESVNSRLRKPIAQTSKEKMGFDLESGHRSGLTVRRRSKSSDKPKKIIPNKKINSNCIERKIVSQSSQLQFESLAARNANPVIQKSQPLKTIDSNVIGKQSSKSRNAEDEQIVKDQIGEIDINLKCPKTLRGRRKLKKTVSKLLQVRKGSMDIFEDSVNSSPGNKDQSKLWDFDLQSEIYAFPDLSLGGLTTTPSKLMDVCTSSTPASSPASSFCKTPKTSYADHYIHKQLKKRKKYKMKTEKPAILQTTNLNKSSQQKADEAYEALIGGKDLPKSLFQFNPRLERSGSLVSSDESYSSNLFD